MRDILDSTPELSTLKETLRNLGAEFPTRLALASSDAQVNNRTVYLAPSNDAFDVLPSAAAVEKALQPSNYDVTALLLRFGMGEVEGRNGERGTKKVRSETGCVWVVSRWLDPLWKLF
ncbi:hypothetical protein BST61_g7406 [Cercospora zeina]